jgi:hypothetical protein
LYVLGHSICPFCTFQDRAVCPICRFCRVWDWAIRTFCTYWDVRFILYVLIVCTICPVCTVCVPPTMGDMYQYAPYIRIRPWAICSCMYFMPVSGHCPRYPLCPICPSQDTLPYGRYVGIALLAKCPSPLSSCPYPDRLGVPNRPGSIACARNIRE